MRTDYAYQDAIRRDFRNKVTAVIAVGFLAIVLTGAIEDNGLLFGGDLSAGLSSVTMPVAENAGVSQ